MNTETDFERLCGNDHDDPCGISLTCPLTFRSSCQHNPQHYRYRGTSLSVEHGAVDYLECTKDGCGHMWANRRREPYISENFELLRRQFALLWQQVWEICRSGVWTLVDIIFYRVLENGLQWAATRGKGGDDTDDQR